jgi:transposase
MKDFDVADVILEIKIIKTSNRLILSRFHYIEKILNKFWQQHCQNINKQKCIFV